MEDLKLDKSYRKGDRGPKVKLIQEWLCLHNYKLVIDGDFGPAVDYAVKKFQKARGLTVDGIVGQNTFGKLIEPMTNVLRQIDPGNNTLGGLVVAYAKQHLKEYPREVGGQNKGPWVRLYMDGKEGVDWPWCAGFVSFILKQACQSIGTPLPIKTSPSCDLLAASAKEKGKFLTESQIVNKTKIKPGTIFLNRKTPTDWVHTGIVIRAETEIYHTIEGNTNDDGSREGYEVCKRIRKFTNTDFIVV